MTDTLTAVPAAAPAIGPTFSPEAVASMRESWVAQGLDPAAFDVAAGLTLAADTAEPSPSGETGAEPSTPPGDALSGGLTLAQITTMADDLIAAGVPEEDIRRALEADGIDAELIEDARTDAEREYDALYPPATPDAYRPNLMGLVPEGTEPQTVAEFNQLGTGWASDLGLDPAIGSFVLEEGLRLGQAYSNAEPAEQELYKVQERQTFERLAGSPEIATQRMENAAKLLAKGNPAFAEGLRKSGALHSAQIVTMLALEYERQQMRG
jgi:hypothetical protein